MYKTEFRQILLKMTLFDVWVFFFFYCFVLCACIKAHWHVPMMTFETVHLFSTICMKSLCQTQRKTLCEKGYNEDLATSPSWKELKDTKF